MIFGKLQGINEGSGGAVTPRSMVKHWEVFDMADDTAIPLNVPYGFCHCGCGQKTPISKSKKTLGIPHQYVNGHWKKGKTPEERFWGKVEKGDGCWVWTAAKNHAGYGQLAFGNRPNRRMALAHRVAWELVNGPIPHDLLVLHKCDNPQCVRPDHLFLGTSADNTHDMDRKGRRRIVPHIGEDNGRAKLTAQDVRDIRSELVILGHPDCGYKAIARRYGVTPQQIRTIVRGEQWKDAEYWPDAELFQVATDSAETAPDAQKRTESDERGPA
jgi:hypothetical protein